MFSTAILSVLAFSFERHYVITELIALPIFVLLVFGSEATSTVEVWTRHFDFWNKPLGSSQTQLPISDESNAPSNLGCGFIVIGAIYLILRLTCLSGLLTMFYTSIGELIDKILRLLQ
jgi:hypothetical protein